MAPIHNMEDGHMGSELMVPGEPTTAQRNQHGTGQAIPAGFGPVRKAVSRLQSTPPGFQGLIALVLYLAVWLPTGALPMVAHPGTPQLDQVSQDPSFYVWALRWWPYAVSHGLNPLYTHQIGVPGGFSLLWITTIPPLSLLAAPLTEIAGPIWSFNLLTVIAMPVSAWAAFVFCRRLTRRFWPALIGGAIFGFSAYEMNHSAAGQLNITYSLLLPLIGYLVLLWRDRAIGARAFVVLTGLAIALQFYLFLEAFADLTAILIIALLVGYVLAGRSFRPLVGRLARLLGAAYLLALVLVGPYLYFALVHAPRFVHQQGLDQDLASLVIPRRGKTFGLHWHWLVIDAHDQIQQSMAGYVGIPLLILAVALAVLTWSSRITRFLTVMLVIIMVASVGQTIYLDGHAHGNLPWGKIWNLPILRSAFPQRLMLFGFLTLAAMAAIFLAGPAKRLWTTRWPLGALVVAALVLNTPSLVLGPYDAVHRTDLPKFIQSGQYRRNITPGETVAVLSSVGDAGMLWQADTNFYFRLAGGFVNAAITPHGNDLPWQIQELSGAKPSNIQQYFSNFRQFVVQAGVGAILVQQKNAPLWAGILRKMGLHGHVVGGVLVYPTHGCAGCHLPVQTGQTTASQQPGSAVTK